MPLGKEASIPRRHTGTTSVLQEPLFDRYQRFRAQAVSRDGRMADDFLIQEANRVVHAVNAPSPAATASLNIGTLTVDTFAPRFA